MFKRLAQITRLSAVSSTNSKALRYSNSFNYIDTNYIVKHWLYNLDLITFSSILQDAATNLPSPTTTFPSSTSFESSKVLNLLYKYCICNFYTPSLYCIMDWFTLFFRLLHQLQLRMIQMRIPHPLQLTTWFLLKNMLIFNIPLQGHPRR